MDQGTLVAIAVTVIVPLLAQVFKRFDIKGSPAFWLVFVLSLIGGAVIVVARGLTLPPISDPVAFVQALGPVALGVFAVSQIIYREVLKRFEWAGAEKS